MQTDSRGGRHGRAVGRALWVLAVTGFVVGLALTAVLVTLRTTALDADWYRSAVAETHTYDRVYNRVLTDPKVARETRDLLAGLPIDHSLVSANLRVVLPPATLQESVDRTITGLTAYLRGDRPHFDPVFALTPVFENIRILADQYLADSVRNLHPLQANTVDEFAANVVQFANDLGAGRRPASLPTIPFTADQVTRLTDVLLGPIPASDREQFRLPVANALSVGDLSTALAAVVPGYGSSNTDHVIIDLQQDANGTHVHVDETLTGIDDARVVIDMRRVRFLTGTVLPWVTVAAALLAVGSLWGVGRLARRSGRRVSTAVAVTVLASGLGLAVLYLGARQLMGDPFGSLFGGSSVPPELHLLLSDLASHLFAGFDEAIVQFLALPVIAAAVALVWLVVAPWVAVRLRVSGPSHRRLVVAAGAVTVVVALVGAWFLLPRDVTTPRACDGHVELCDRPYDGVVFAEAHNAMSASDLRWLGANQDVPMTAQLDAGVRVLHIDTRYWETPEATAKFAATLPPQQAGIVLAAVAGANPVRPGVWLCHALCRLGATKLETGLRQIRSWVEDHPDDVITLDVEDRTSAEDTVAIFRKVGLDKYAVTPGAADQPWPTLGELLDSGKRVVVFAERHGGSPGWYAPLYQHAMETPYTFRNVKAFTCKAKRGGKDKRLFVMNHFITRAAPNRTDAAVVNSRDAIVKRARKCAKVRGRTPNFVQVDFATLGDVNGAVDELNGVSRSG